MDPLLRPLILASSSPRRQALLQELGEPFESLDPSVDETLPPGPLLEAVALLAERKALAVAGSRPRGTILAGDTVVEVAGEVLGKPTDDADARRMLGLLSGTTHRVHTGVAVLHVRTGLLLSGTATTRIRMREIAPQEIAAYVASGESRGKAGAYAVQETADRFVEGLEGDHDNVVGLPLHLVRDLLERLGRRVSAGEP